MNKIRAEKLDEKLKDLLQNKIKNHPDLDPIIASRLAKELELNSRSTLSTTKRKKWIDNAKKEQYQKHNLNLSGKKKVRDKDLQIEKLKNEVKLLKIERNNLIEKIAEIINGAQAHGLDIEKIMLPII